MSNVKWTEEQIQFLRENIDKMSNVKFAEHLNTTVRTIESTLGRYGIKRFDPNDIEFDDNDLKTMSMQELSDKYKCSKSFISKIKSKRNLVKEKTAVGYEPKSDEVFKSVHFGGDYKISNYGNLINNKNVLMKYFDSNGYLRVNLVITKGNRKKFFIHRLVAEVFLDKIPGKDVVNHIDHNSKNNHVLNLEWCTASENNSHMMSQSHVRENLSKINSEKGSNEKSNKTELINNICEDILQEMSNTEIANKYGLTNEYVRRIRKKEMWTKISDNFF